jgi:hypothetical protein
MCGSHHMTHFLDFGFRSLGIYVRSFQKSERQEPQSGDTSVPTGLDMISLPLLARAWPCCYIKTLRYKKLTSYLISKALQIRPGPALFRDLPRRRLDSVSYSRAGPLRNTGRYHLLMMLLVISRDFNK